MTEMTYESLSVLIARRIFQCGDETNSPCTRIQFKGGKWPDNERNQGGIGEEPLATLIKSVLNEAATTNKPEEPK